MPANRPYPNETTAQFQARAGKRPARGMRGRKRNPFMAVQKELAPKGSMLTKAKARLGM